MNPLTGAGALARPRAHGRFVHACRALTISATALVAILLFPSGAFGAQKGINTDITWFVTDMAARYRGDADAWEVWNEENLPRFWPTGVSASQYAQMLVAAAPVIRSNDPGVPVVFGGLAHNDYGYLQAAYHAVPNL